MLACVYVRGARGNEGRATYGTESTTICASGVDSALVEVPDGGFAELWLGERLLSRRIGHDLAIPLEVSRRSDELGDSRRCRGGANGKSCHEGFEGGELHLGDCKEEVSVVWRVDGLETGVSIRMMLLMW